MIFKKIAAVLAFVLVSVFAQAHDYHTSITDAQFNPRTNSLQVAVKMFTDDLENALSKKYKKTIAYSASSEEVNKYLSDYLQSNLTFELVKGKPLKGKFIGSEEEADVVWAYVEIPLQTALIPQLFVRNTVLTEVFNDQMNIVNIKYKGEVSSELLRKGELEKKFTF